MSDKMLNYDCGTFYSIINSKISSILLCKNEFAEYEYEDEVIELVVLWEPVTVMSPLRTSLMAMALAKIHKARKGGRLRSYRKVANIRQLCLPVLSNTHHFRSRRFSCIKRDFCVLSVCARPGYDGWPRQDDGARWRGAHAAPELRNEPTGRSPSRRRLWTQKARYR